MLKTKEEIKNWLAQYDISKCTILIEDNLVVNVIGDLNLNGNPLLKEKHIVKLPIQFGIIQGGFCIAGNSLKTLKGCPKEVHGSFDASNNDLKSLKDAPSFVSLIFNVNNNRLVTLTGCPAKIGNLFLANYNNLKTLEYGPQEVNGSYCVTHNQLISLKGSPKIIPGMFNCANNQLASLQDGPKKIKLLACQENKITSLKYFPEEIEHRVMMYGNHIALSEYQNLNIKENIIFDYDKKEDIAELARYDKLDSSINKEEDKLHIPYQLLNQYFLKCKLNELLVIKHKQSFPKL